MEHIVYLAKTEIVYGSNDKEEKIYIGNTENEREIFTIIIN